ncbi:OLC1v1000488C1 [Oldenlandia corymbosa var. corymbosa]|uniref:OLC1v1000488C1 n=1 Tax=Oldenlandia corymbosa var. corymbosa TaxID=529605 RepID=A0AAV1D3B9_OLDCO|nr:OLC1v1000488C1 [Oldenlandia corymbosa var. corymbosa]
MAEDDDDDGFGDFTFASFNPSSINSNSQTHQNNGLKSPITTTTAAPTGKDDGGGDDDDEWGDFVETPLGSFTSSNNTPSKSSSLDPFNGFFQNPNPTSNLEKSDSGNSAPAKFEPTVEQKKENQNQNGWVKLKGAIPLSIFGDIEEDENEEAAAGSGLTGPHHVDGKDLNTNKKVDNASDPLKTNGNLGFSFNYDAITSLYNQHSSITNNGVDVPVNGVGLDTNGADIGRKDSNLESNEWNFVGVSMHKRGDSDSAMDLSSQTLQWKDGVNGSSNGITSNLNALDLDFSGWNVDFNANLNSNVMTNVNDHSLQSGDENVRSRNNSDGVGSDMKATSYTLFDGLNLKSDVNESNLFPSSVTTNGVDKTLNFNRQKEEFHGSKNDDGDGDHDIDGDGNDDDEWEWEFKDAHAPSQVGESNEKVRYPVEVERTDENNAIPKLGNGTVGSTDLFTASNGSDDLFSMSNGFSSKSDWLDVGFGISSSNTTDNQVASDAYLSGDQTGSNAILNPHSVTETADSDEDFGDFAAAYVESAEMSEADSKVLEPPNKNASSLGFDASNGLVDFPAFHGSTNLFQPSNGKFGDPNEVSAGLDINFLATDHAEAAHNSYTFDKSLRSEQLEGTGVQDPDFDKPAESDEIFGDFREASAENALREKGELKIFDQPSEPKGLERDNNVQDNEIRRQQYQGALPLSIFGEEENEVDGSSNIDDAFILQPAPSKGNDHSPKLPTSINDLISNLYSQDEHVSSSSPVSNLVENGLGPSNTVSDANDDSSWEFKDSFSHDVAESGRSPYENENADERSSSKLKLQSYVDFYSKLQDELYFIAKDHLASLKDNQSGENWAALAEEIQVKELGPENATTEEDNLGNHISRDSNLNNFVDLLQEPKFHVFQMEYDLERKLLEVEKDVGSVVELIQHAKTMLKILMLGSSEVQSSYVSVWSKMISACAQEMRHGAAIWRQALEKNISSQILVEPGGKTFVLALGEIYRAAVLLEASVKLYKPWIISSHIELSKLYSLLEECHSSWSSSGLQQALSSVIDAALSEGYPNLPALLDSVEYIYDLDELALQNHVFSPQEPLCRLSLLTPDVAPGMAMVSWDGEHCFLRLANLWVNLISTDHPKLPSLRVNG